jgi:hypothetical protein
MALAPPRYFKVKAKRKRRWRNNERKGFYFKRNLCFPLSPEAEDRLCIDDQTYVKEEIIGTSVVLTFYKKEPAI